ncbi:MAG: hypothetical protein IH899_14680 [Planctomycetes bacterium]|nr:hypothetical protein [Planctomycetota bacterium]
MIKLTLKQIEHYAKEEFPVIAGSGLANRSLAISSGETDPLHGTPEVICQTLDEVFP